MIIDSVVERANIVIRLDRMVKRAARVDVRTTEIVYLAIQIKKCLRCLLVETCAGKLHRRGEKQETIFAKVCVERKGCYGYPDNDEKLNMKMYV